LNPSPMLSATRVRVTVVVQQHAEESAILRGTRARLVVAPHVRLHHLRRLDDRIAAHLDGLAVAGDYGWKLAVAALANPGVGESFTAGVRVLEDRNIERLDKLLAMAEGLPQARSGLVGAFAWVSAQSLRGVTKALLDSHAPFRRLIGLAVCATHRVDPLAALNAALGDTDAALRACALQVAGRLGRVDVLNLCLDSLADEDEACRFQAACAAVLLGDRRASVAQLQVFAAAPGPCQGRALRLLLKVASPEQARVVLKALSFDPADIRKLIRGVGLAGDVHYVPWLIRQMNEPKLTRIAGESFSLITGLDLALLDIDRNPPEGIEFGPNDDPGDGDVAMDEDDGLPWPDTAKIEAWWRTNGSRFAAGTRYFIGEPPTPAHCLHVLKSGLQRQRIAAAQHLCLQQPGVPLFDTQAPAWRQQRWLDDMASRPLTA
jgi:uncharacterized protein (TIGR02270 family)